MTHIYLFIVTEILDIDLDKLHLVKYSLVFLFLFLMLSFCQFHFFLAQNSCVFLQHTLPSDFIYKSLFCFPFALILLFWLPRPSRIKVYVIAA